MTTPKRPRKPNYNPPFDVGDMTPEGQALVMNTLLLLLHKAMFMATLTELHNMHDPEGVAVMLHEAKRCELAIGVAQDAIGKERIDLLRRQAQEIIAYSNFKYFGRNHP